jgi:hypothetical protein
MNTVNTPGSVSTSIVPPCWLDNDVMSDQEAEPRSFPGRFGGEERIEHLVPDLGGDAGAVVANPDFDRVAKLPGGGAEDRLEARVACVDLAPGRGIDAVGNQVQQGPDDLLGIQLDRSRLGIEIVFERDVEARLLRPCDVRSTKRERRPVWPSASPPPTGFSRPGPRNAGSVP